jgi:hypothetical protein
MKALPLAILALLIAAPAKADTAQDAFFARLTTLCGKTFQGQVVTTDPADASFAGKPLIMQVATCSKDEVRIPFHVGEDRSRTWIITRTPAGLRLKHDHRHADGTEDAVSQYGGDTTTPGTASRQEFPVDAASKAMFVREDRGVSLTNVWAIEIEPSQTFAYELRRPGRHFRVEFDLKAPLP